VVRERGGEDAGYWVVGRVAVGGVASALDCNVYVVAWMFSGVGTLRYFRERFRATSMSRLTVTFSGSSVALYRPSE
jgi:hypothetical protein